MNCGDCKFEWNAAECNSSCCECKYKEFKNSYICEKCRELFACKDNGGCYFEEEDGDEE